MTQEAYDLSVDVYADLDTAWDHADDGLSKLRTRLRAAQGDVQEDQWKALQEAEEHVADAIRLIDKAKGCLEEIPNPEDEDAEDAEDEGEDDEGDDDAGS